MIIYRSIVFLSVSSSVGIISLGKATRIEGIEGIETATRIEEANPHPIKDTGEKDRKASLPSRTKRTVEPELQGLSPHMVNVGSGGCIQYLFSIMLESDTTTVQSNCSE